ncbi:MAG: hypothetical protein F6K26_08335 [Moorea sp. SIO2I5]|nr:hypothetical protein [Moorena sp. SIO2I5]
MSSSIALQSAPKAIKTVRLLMRSPKAISRPCLLNPSRPSPCLLIPIFQSKTTDLDGEMGRLGDGQMKLICSRNEPEWV